MSGNKRIKCSAVAWVRSIKAILQPITAYTEVISSHRLRFLPSHQYSDRGASFSFVLADPLVRHANTRVVRVTVLWTVTLERCWPIVSTSKTTRVVFFLFIAPQGTQKGHPIWTMQKYNLCSLVAVWRGRPAIGSGKWLHFLFFMVRSSRCVDIQVWYFM